MPSEAASQLDAASHMAGENQTALDTILEEKGGVYVMQGGKCCTFISSNTAPDGTLAKALQGLTTLASKVAENAGTSDTGADWLEG